jgi:hypothetical protein
MAAMRGNDTTRPLGGHRTEDHMKTSTSPLLLSLLGAALVALAACSSTDGADRITGSGPADPPVCIGLDSVTANIQVQRMRAQRLLAACSRETIELKAHLVAAR